MLHIQKQILIIQGFDHKSNEAEYVNRLPEKDIVSFIPKKRGWRRKRKEEGELKEFHSRWLYSALCLEDIVPQCAGTKPKMSARCLEVEPVVKVQGSLAGGDILCSGPVQNLVWDWSDILVWDWSGTFWFLKHSFPEWLKQIKPCFASIMFFVFLLLHVS